ncbi:MAG: hypothetical protein P1U67_12385 [Alcanivoracaceae bacterium]|nr:hypothetical protein [Alcanivoracaceae bacterium]
MLLGLLFFFVNVKEKLKIISRIIFFAAVDRIAEATGNYAMQLVGNYCPLGVSILVSVAQ